jgi:hypothetical protein
VSTQTETYSISALHRLTKLDRATIRKLLSEVKPVEEKAKEKLYALKDALPALIGGKSAEMDGAKLRKLQTEAALKELELKRESGDLLSVKEVRDYLQDLFKRLQQRTSVQLPREIAPLLYKAESSAQITEILQRELGRLFNDLRSNHQGFQ